MLLYEDKISGDEMFSDAFPMCVSPDRHKKAILTWCHSKEVDGIAYEVDCSLVTVKPGADVDIGTLTCLIAFHWCL